MKVIDQCLSSMDKREGAASCVARHVLVAQSGSLQIFDRALGVVREKGIDAEFGIVPPFVFAVGDARKNQYAGALQARCFGTVDFAETEHEARGLVAWRRRDRKSVV